MNDEDIKSRLTPRPDLGFDNYMEYAFNCSALNAMCRQLKKVFDDLDRNRNGVLEPSER